MSAGFISMFTRYQAVINHHKPRDQSVSQPTRASIAGGLAAIEETALGNIQKIGRKCAVDGVLEQAEMPTDPGLWLMDSSSAAAETVTLCAASGCAIHCFPTGQGNGIGNAIVPVIKICANPRTLRLMSEHVGGATLGLLQRRITRDRAGAASTCGMTRSRLTTHCAVVGKVGIGLDNIDVEACKARSIRVAAATGANALGVAECVTACDAGLAADNPVFAQTGVCGVSVSVSIGVLLRAEARGLVSHGLSRIIARPASGNHHAAAEGVRKPVDVVLSTRRAFAVGTFAR